MNTKIKNLTGLLVLSLAVGTTGAADPPGLVNYQGVLRDSSGDPEDGSFDMVFRFFDAEFGGDEVLVDTHDAGNALAVTVAQGLFNVQLGGGLVTDGSGAGSFLSLTEVFQAHDEVWLELRIDGEDLSPRVRVLSAAYALNAGSVQGLDPEQFLRSDTSDTYTSGTLTTAAGTIVDVNGSLYLDGQLFMDQDGPDGVQSIFFYNSGEPAGESIDWDEFNERFFFSGNANFSSGSIFLDERLITWDDANSRFSFSQDVHVSTGQLFLDFAESLSWDGTDVRFELSDALAIGGPLRVGSIAAGSVGYSTIGGGTPDSGDISSVSDLYVTADLEIDSQLYLAGELRMADADGDQEIYFFDDGVGTDEALAWDDSDDRFELTNDVAVDGVLTVGLITGTPVGFSQFGFGSTDTSDVTTSSDVYIADDLEVDGTTFPGILSGTPNGGHLFQADLGIAIVIDDDNNSSVERVGWYHHSTSSSDKLMDLAEDGDLRIGGTLSQNTNFDLAESFWMAEAVEPGELVAVDAARPDAVRRTAGQADPLLLGVVSHAPGVLLGGAPFSAQALEKTWGPQIREAYEAEAETISAELLVEFPELDRSGAEDYDEGALEGRSIARFFEHNFAPVALSGRVPVKVDARFGEIVAGDTLVPSPIPGVAMKARGQGPIVGTALEGLAEGAGMVLTFVHRGSFVAAAPPTEPSTGTEESSAVESTPIDGPEVARDLVGGLRITLDSATGGHEIFRVDEGGNVWAQGAFLPASTDLAEYHPVAQPVEVGDVLVVDRSAPGRLRKGSVSSDPAVVGIVAGEPGVLLGGSLSRIQAADAELSALLDEARWNGDSEEQARLWRQLEAKFRQAHAPIALSGTVACKVDAGYGPIEIGDLLATSPTVGHAMRVLDPLPGTVIGKAVEPLEAGTGLIRVLVMLR